MIKTASSTVRALRSLLCLALISASCKSSTEDPVPVMSTAVVPCMEAAGTEVFGRVLAESNVGPDFCSRALRRYLLANPAVLIVDVIPVDAVVKYPKLDETRRETKDLLVVKADRGGWPLARDLEVDETSCSAGDEESPRHCAFGLNKALKYARDVAIWIPITFEEDEVFNRRSGTGEILYLYRRRDGVAPIQM